MKPWERAQAAAIGSVPKLLDPNGGGALIMSNTATAITSGPDGNVIAMFLNGLMQWLKRFSRFDQKTWGFPTICFLAMAIAIGLERDHIELAIKHGMNYAGQAWVNFASLADSPIMPPAGQ